MSPIDGAAGRPEILNSGKVHVDRVVDDHAILYRKVNAIFLRANRQMVERCGNAKSREVRLDPVRNRSRKVKVRSPILLVMPL
jgi:hypothetical protein